MMSFDQHPEVFYAKRLQLLREIDTDRHGRMHARVRRNGLPVPDLRVTFYGMKEFRIKDPDGNSKMNRDNIFPCITPESYLGEVGKGNYVAWDLGHSLVTMLWTDQGSLVTRVVAGNRVTSSLMTPIVTPQLNCIVLKIVNAVS